MPERPIGCSRARGWVAALVLCSLAAACSPQGGGEPAGSAQGEEAPAPTGPPPNLSPVPNQPRSFPLLERLDWLAGSWVGESEGRRCEEHWLPAAGGMMLGVHREVSASGLGRFEYMRILGLPSGAVFFASPSGMPATQFPLISSGDRSVTFENLDHDYPQRIIYRLEGDELHARIEGEVRGILDFKEWTFRRSERGLDALAPEQGDGDGE